MLINWVEDSAARVVLDDIGIEMVDQTISVQQIDKKASRENRARACPLDETRIEGIKCAAQKGVPIPKIVVRRVGAKYIIAGGNHRFSSLNGQTEIPVHVIEGTDEEFEVACRVLNTVVGVGMTSEERMENAIDAVNRLGLTKQAAADIYGVSPHTLNAAIRTKAIEIKASSLFPHRGRKISKTQIIKLGDIAYNDNVLKAACEMIAATNASSKEVGELAALARTKSTEAEQVAVFEEAAALKRKDAKKIVRRNKRIHFLSLITQVRQLGAVRTWADLQIESSEADQVKQQIRDAINTLKNLCKVNG